MEEFFENEAVKRFEEMLENKQELFFDAEQYEDIISYYLEIGDYQFAETAYEYAQKLYPDSVNIKIRKLEVLLEKDQNEEAKEIIEEIRDFAMENLDFIICCAKYYSNINKPKKAILYCEKALEKEEDEDFIYNFIADEYRNIDDAFHALENYKKALEHEPNDGYSLENIMLCYSEMNRPKEALEFLNSYLDDNAFSEVAWFEYGNFHFNRKEYAQAIVGFDYLLAINPTSITVYSNKAACYEAMDNWEKAIETYEESQEYEYTKSYSFYKIGLAYVQMNQREKAIETFQKSLYEDPQFHLSMISISQVYEELGDSKQAIVFANEALKLNENNLELQKKLAFLYIDSGQLDNSLGCLKKLVQNEPKRFYNWYAYAEVLMLLSQYEKAEKAITKAIERHKRAELYYQLSNCYFHLNKEKQAQDSLQKALEIDSDLLPDMRLKYPSLKEDVAKEQKNKECNSKTK